MLCERQHQTWSLARPPCPDRCLNPGVRLPCCLGDLCAPKPCMQACRCTEGSHPLAPKAICPPWIREPRPKELWQVPSGLQEAGWQPWSCTVQEHRSRLLGRAVAMASRAGTHHWLCGGCGEERRGARVQASSRWVSAVKLTWD